MRLEDKGNELICRVIGPRCLVDCSALTYRNGMAAVAQLLWSLEKVRSHVLNS